MQTIQVRISRLSININIMRKIAIVLLILFCCVAVKCSFGQTLKFTQIEKASGNGSVVITTGTNNVLTYTNALPAALIPTLSAYVPYTGATTSVNLGANSFSTGSTFITHTSSTLPALTVKTETANTDGSIFTNGSNTLAITPVTLSGGSAIYNGPWIRTITNENMHFVGNVGLPQMTLAKTQGGNNPLILNSFSTYTSSANLRVAAGGLVNVIEAEGTAGELTWYLQRGSNTVNQASKGYATFGSTVLSVGQPTILNVGTYSQTAQTFSIGSTGLTGGNSGTISVLTDNYFTITTSFPLLAMSSAATYYFSNIGQLRSTVGQCLSSIPYNCTLVGASINAWNAGSTTSQTVSTINFRLNESDNVISSNVLWNTSGSPNIGINSNVTGLNVSCTAGNTYEMKLVLGTMATPPNNGNLTVVLYFARR